MSPTLDELKLMRDGHLAAGPPRKVTRCSRCGWPVDDERPGRQVGIMCGSFGSIPVLEHIACPEAAR